MAPPPDDDGSFAGRTGQLVVDRRRVLVVLSGLTAVLVVVGTASALLLRSPVPFAVESIARLFLLNEEADVASWWGSVLLLGCAAGFVLASGAAPALRTRLRTLALLLVALSMDETAIVHERATGALALVIRGSSDSDDPLWVVVAVPLVLLVGWYLLPVLRRVPQPVRNRLWLAGALYVGGAVGVELLSALLSGGSVLREFAVALEEGMEYAGPIVLIDALLLLASGGPQVRIRWAAEDADGSDHPRPSRTREPAVGLSSSNGAQPGADGGG